MSKPRIRDLGYSPGQLKTGEKNSLLDVPGVQVGQVTLHTDDGVNTGVTVILPRGVKNTRLKPCYAALHCLNGVGEMTGSHQMKEWGYTFCPIAFTNTLSVGKVYDAVFQWQLDQAEAAGVDEMDAIRNFSIPVVGETFDGLLNDIRRSYITKEHVYDALSAAPTQEKIFEGNFGGGTGMRCFGYKGGVGTSSRVISGEKGKQYTVGVIVQSNYGASDDLNIGGVPIGKLLKKEDAVTNSPGPSPGLPTTGKAAEGSILVLTITDAPMLPHQLRRLAQHSGMGVAKVAGGHGAGRNFSGEIFLALSTGTSADQLATESDGFGYLPTIETLDIQAIKGEVIDTLFYAASEATEESILNAMCQATSMTGFKGRSTAELPLDRVRELLQKYVVTL